MQPAASSQQGTTPAQRECPTCHVLLPIDPHYVTWCDSCGWNLQPQPIARPRTLFESFYLSLGQRLSAGLFDEVKRAALLAPRLTLSTAVAGVLAGLVHGLTLACAILGVVLLARGAPNPIPTIGGLLCLMIAWTLRPRLGKLPAGSVSAAQFPKLHALVERIAQTLGARHVPHLIIDERFNASFSQVGWRRQPVIWIGLPLFAILSPQEQVAILAHEIAHGVNGDPNRGLFIGAAIRSLVQWHRLLRPEHLRGTVTRGFGSVGCLLYISSAVTNILMLGLSTIPWLWAYGLSHLLWRGSQRAEYLADFLAAQVSGTDAMLSALEKLHYTNAFQHTVREIALSQTTPNFVDTLRQNVARMPAREVERIRRVEQLALARLDVTHPPTAHRIDLLRAHPFVQPSFILSAAEAEQIEGELLQMQPHVQQKLLDAYLSRLYYH